MSYNVNNYTNKLLKELADQKDSYILEALNDLLSRGLLELHQTSPVLVQEPGSNTIKLLQSVKLVLKDKEYIEKLEKENADLKERFSQITALVRKNA